MGRSRGQPVKFTTYTWRPATVCNMVILSCRGVSLQAVKYPRKREPVWILLLKLVGLLGNLVLELAHLSAVHVLHESDSHHEQRHVDDDELYGVIADPVVLGLLGL